jgi:hypothetical protein
MLSLAVSSLAFSAPFAPAVAPRVAPTMQVRGRALKNQAVKAIKNPVKTMQSAGSEDLVTLAEELNPQIGFWDPLGLAKRDFW